MRKAFCFLLFVALAGCSGAGIGSQAGGAGTQSANSALPATLERAPQSIAASRLWNIGTGASTMSYAIQDLDFLPAAITINAGDSIAYHVGSGGGGDAHTVAFVPKGMPVPSPGDPNDISPSGGTSTSATVDGTKFTNSGILFGGQTYTLRFTAPGTYTVYCLFHEPAMKMTVVVQRPGSTYPHTAQFYLDQGSVDEWQDFGAAENSVASFPFKNGGTTFAAGIDPGLTAFPPHDSTVLRFLNTNKLADVSTAGSITIKVGTKLTWVNETSNEPHTVTIVRAGGTDLPNAPPDPAFGGNVFDGSKTINSGTLLGEQHFSATFTKAGTFLYGCLYHDNSRMTGHVTVTP